MIGKIKFYDESRCYGFVHDEAGERDVYLPQSSLSQAGIVGLKKGDVIEFDVLTSENTGRTKAVSIRLIERSRMAA